MDQPMLLPGGQSFNKPELDRWMAQNGNRLINPWTRLHENKNELKPNVPLENFISAYNLTDVPEAGHFPDKADDMSGGKPRKITRRRRNKLKRTIKKRRSKKSKRLQK